MGRRRLAMQPLQARASGKVQEPTSAAYLRLMFTAWKMP